MSKSENLNRAEKARSALDTYGMSTGDMEENIIDLLSDLMHLCQQQTSIEFDDAIRMAKSHYEEEK